MTTIKDTPIAKDTRTAILDAAQDMVQRQSISGVSFQELAKRTGIKKGSMYYHFESKDDLSIALLERAAAEMKDSFTRGEGKSPTQRLEYYLNIYRFHIIPSEKMCPGGSFAGEWGKLTDPVQAQVQRLINEQSQCLQQVLSAGIASGEFYNHGQSDKDLTQWLVACIQGGLLTSRVSGSREPFEAAIKVAMQYLTHS